MKERLTRNLDLKILAIVFAIILWLIVVNIDDPVKSNTFSGIEVQILNAEELEKQGLCYDVLDNTNIVSVTVSGRRSVIEEINRENIIATADMKDLSSMNTLTVKVTSNKSAGDLRRHDLMVEQDLFIRKALKHRSLDRILIDMRCDYFKRKPRH